MGDVGFVCQSFVIIILQKANNEMPLFEKNGIKWHTMTITIGMHITYPMEDDLFVTFVQFVFKSNK